MSLDQRLRKLEQAVAKGDTEESEHRLARCLTGEHPPGMFHLYRVYAGRPGYPRRLVTKGHCDSCGFDSYYWDVSNTTPEQWQRTCELTAEYKEKEYVEALIDQGFLDYVDWDLRPAPEGIAATLATNYEDFFGVDCLELAIN